MSKFLLAILATAGTISACSADSPLPSVTQSDAFDCTAEQDDPWCHFANVVERHVTETSGGYLDHGVEPRMIRESFDGIKKSDFDGVAVSQGVFHYRNGELEFKRKDEPLTSAPVTMTRQGYQRLFDNLKKRTGLNPATPEQAQQFAKDLQ